MAYEQVRDVIDRAKRLHHEIGDFYESTKEVVEKEKMKIILNYLSRHERFFEEKLTQFERDADPDLLNTWYKYAPTDEVNVLLETLDVKPEMIPEEIVAMALKFDDVMLHLYKQAAETAAVPEVREIFENLFEEGKKERSKMVQDVFGFE